jgi:deoxyribodipyrimidine photo-lyase
MVSIFWFRRDLRLVDNTALIKSLEQEENVIPIFIFDESITDELPKDDSRISFIYQNLNKINKSLSKTGNSILCLKGTPLQLWEKLINDYDIGSVYINKDYEPYAKQRDKEVHELLEKSNIRLEVFKDQVIFEEHEIVKNDGLPYSVYTPYKNKWLDNFKLPKKAPLFNSTNFYPCQFDFPTLEELGFQTSTIKVKDFDLNVVDAYEQSRDIPSLDATSYLSPHLRFGTVSIRQIILALKGNHGIFLNELIWREFFMQILFHYPKVVTNNFRPKYDVIQWRNEEKEFDKWCKGNTGYPLVDAGMRQLNETGYMHNRVRMITAGFLCKHLLIDWKWGEAYFATKLLDYELSANNGNWQWAAGTGCDAAPYFRIFNPSEQLKKFDKKLEYVKKWVPEVLTGDYPQPMVEHKFARQRALNHYSVIKENNI